MNASAFFLVLVGACTVTSWFFRLIDWIELPPYHGKRQR